MKKIEKMIAEVLIVSSCAMLSSLRDVPTFEDGIVWSMLALATIGLSFLLYTESNIVAYAEAYTEIEK